MHRRKQCTIQDDHLRARHSIKKRTEQLSLGYDKVMELKLIKREHDEPLKVMVKPSTQRILYRRIQHRMVVCGQGMQSRRMDRTTESQKWQKLWS